MPKVKSSPSSSSRSSPARAQPVAEEGPISADFHAQVYAVVRRVPEGRVTSYGAIAKILGHPRHSRLVGQALKLMPRAYAFPTLPQARAPSPPPGTSPEPLPEPDPNPDWVPWHRVVNSSGVISPRGNGQAVRRQAEWLEAEGVEVRDGARAGGGNGGAGRDGGGHNPADAFGLGGFEGGRVSMARYGWAGEN